VASPFGCRSGHIPLSRKPPCPGTGRLARASALLLMHAQRNTTMRDCQPMPRGDGHRPWKLWLERHSKDTEGCPLDFHRLRDSPRQHVGPRA